MSCSLEMPSLTFMIGGVNFSLTGEDLIYKETSSDCSLGLVSFESKSSSAPQWILGDAFMRKYYVQFDWSKYRMGFALAATGSHPNKTDILV